MSWINILYRYTPQVPNILQLFQEEQFFPRVQVPIPLFQIVPDQSNVIALVDRVSKYQSRPRAKIASRPFFVGLWTPQYLQPSTNLPCVACGREWRIGVGHFV